MIHKNNVTTTKLMFNFPVVKAQPTCVERSHTPVAALFRFQYIAHPYQMATYSHFFHVMDRVKSILSHPNPYNHTLPKTTICFERPRNNVAVLYRFLLITGSQTDGHLQPLLPLDGSCQRDFVRNQGLPRGTTTSYWGHVCQSGPLQGHAATGATGPGQVGWVICIGAINLLDLVK